MGGEWEWGRGGGRRRDGSTRTRGKERGTDRRTLRRKGLCRSKRCVCHEERKRGVQSSAESHCDETRAVLAADRHMQEIKET